MASRATVSRANPAPKEGRQRETFRFALNPLREKAIIQEIKTLKRDRAFTDAARKGLSLFYDLTYRQSVELLLILFPWVLDRVISIAIAQGLVRAVSDTEKAAENEELQTQLRRIESLLLQRGDVPIPLPTASTRQTVPRSDASDVDLLEVKPKSPKPSNSGRILLLQVWLASNVEHIELFSLDDLELVTGHPAFNQTLVEAEKARRRSSVAATPVSVAPPLGKSKKIKGSEIELPPPNFDDLDLL